MPRKDPRIDSYITKSAQFAKPVLQHLRKLVHQACPEVEETMKWRFPHFMHKGILCSMAAFKNHCSFGFWKRALILEARKGYGNTQDGVMGQFGRITSVADLPSERVLSGSIKEAVRLNEEGVKVPVRSKSKAKRELIVPGYFMAALKQNNKAFAAFNKSSYSHKKEYVEWITEAKREETRERWIKTALQWLAQSKSRNWKYEKC